MAQILEEAESIACFFHKNPDGDAVGSALAVKNFFGDKVKVYSYHGVPEIFRFLPKADEVIKYEDFSEVEPAQIFLVLDCGDERRIPGFDASRASTIVVVDHHETNDGFGDVSIVEPDRSSTCEIVYEILKETGRKISTSVAECLFAGIYTDTGGFRYSDTTATTFQVAKELVEAGADPWKITLNIYDSNPVRRIKLLSLCLGTLQLHLEGKVASLYVTLDMYEKTGALPEDTEDFVNYARGIKGVEVAVFMRELHEGGVKVSLRSKGKVNVARIARRLGGGGHANAAGCELDMGIEKALESILDILKEEI